MGVHHTQPNVACWKEELPKKCWGLSVSKYPREALFKAHSVECHSSRSVPWRRGPTDPLPLPPPEDQGEDAHLGGGCSPESRAAGTMIWGFPVSKTVRTQCCSVHKPVSRWYFCYSSSSQLGQTPKRTKWKIKSIRWNSREGRLLRTGQEELTSWHSDVEAARRTWHCKRQRRDSFNKVCLIFFKKSSV